jgi:hypothetical protein
MPAENQIDTGSGKGFFRNLLRMDPGVAALEGFNKGRPTATHSGAAPIRPDIELVAIGFELAHGEHRGRGI